VIKLVGKRLISDLPTPVGDVIKVHLAQNTDKIFFLIINGKGYEMYKEGTVLTWTIPENIDKSRFSFRIQAITPDSREISFITNVLSLITRTTVESETDGVHVANSTTVTTTYFYDEDYEIRNIIPDEPVIRIVNKQIKIDSLKSKIVTDDSMSKILMFDIPKFQDGINLAKMSISINHVNAAREEGRSIACNVKETENLLVFGWILDDRITKKAGVVKFSIRFVGYNELGELYSWGTLPSQITVEQGLNVDESIRELETKNPTVIDDLIVKMSTIEDLLSDGTIDIGSRLIERLINMENQISEVQSQLQNLTESLHNCVCDDDIDVILEEVGLC
jgi:hypothetical protein